MDLWLFALKQRWGLICQIGWDEGSLGLLCFFN